MKRQMWSCIHVVCFCGFLVGMGCNQGRSNIASITGEVKLDGNPLEQGLIRFFPLESTEGSITSGEIIQGRYHISGKAGPAIGWNRVEINGTRRTGRMTPKPFPQRGTMEETVEAVAPTFNSESVLTYEVKLGNNTADFEVASK